MRSHIIFFGYQKNNLFYHLWLLVFVVKLNLHTLRYLNVFLVLCYLYNLLNYLRIFTVYSSIILVLYGTEKYGPLKQGCFKIFNKLYCVMY